MELNEGYQAVLEELFGNSQSSPSSPSPSDVKITVKTFHGNYLGATPEGKVVGNRERPIDYEIWTLKKYEGHYFSLCSFYNQYLSVDQNSQVTTSPNVGPNESWEIYTNGQKKYFKNAKTEKFLCVEPSGLVVCDRTKVKKWESFFFTKVSFGKQRSGALCSHKGNFLHFDDLHNAFAVKERVSASEILAFEKRGAYWAIRTASGAYIGANEEGRVYNTSNEVTDNEKWTKYKLGKHQSYYQSFHGKYLCADEHGCVVADRIKPKKWEVWKHEWIN